MRGAAWGLLRRACQQHSQQQARAFYGRSRRATAGNSQAPRPQAQPERRPAAQWVHALQACGCQGPAVDALQQHGAGHGRGSWLRGLAVRQVPRTAGLSAQAARLPSTADTPCARTAPRQEIPYTHRKHALFVSQGLEKSLGRQAFDQVGQCRCSPARLQALEAACCRAGRQALRVQSRSS